MEILQAPLHGIDRCPPRVQPRLDDRPLRLDRVDPGVEPRLGAGAFDGGVHADTVGEIEHSAHQVRANRQDFIDAELVGPCSPVRIRLYRQDLAGADLSGHGGKRSDGTQPGDQDAVTGEEAPPLHRIDGDCRRLEQCPLLERHSSGIGVS